MRKLVITLLIIFYTYIGGSAQELSIQWQRICFNFLPAYPDHYYNFKLNDGLLIIGNTQVCDTVFGGTHGDADFFAIKFDYNGNVLWRRIFGGSGYDVVSGTDVSMLSQRIFIAYSTGSTDGDFSYLKNADFSETGIIILDFNGNEIKRIKSDVIVPELGQKHTSSLFLKYSVSNNRLVVWANLNDEAGHDEAYSKGRTIIMLWDVDLRDSHYCVISNENIAKPSELSDNYPIYISAVEFDERGDLYFLLSQFSKVLRFEKDNTRKVIAIQNFNEARHNNSDFAMSSKSCIVKLSNDLSFISACGTGVDYREDIYKTFLTAPKSSQVICFSQKDNVNSNLKKWGGSDFLISFFNDNLAFKNQYQIATSKNETPCSVIGSGDFENTLLALYNVSKFLDSRTTKSNEKERSENLPQLENLGLENITNADSASVGLKLISINKEKIQRKANFNIDDKSAKIFKLKDDLFVIAATVPTKGSFGVVLIGFDPKQSKVLWIAKPGENRNEKIIDIFPDEENNFVVIGLKDPVNALTGYKLWLVKYAFDINDPKHHSFVDNLNITSVADKGIIDLLLDEKVSADSLLYFRNLSYSIFGKNNANTRALQAFAMLSELAGDYDLATSAYKMLLNKTDKIKAKADYSKFRAHQISCRFLSQSGKKKEAVKKEATLWAHDFGYFGIGIKFEILNKRLIVLNTLEGWPAYNAGIKPFDEIVSVNGIPLTNTCLNNQSAKKNIGDTKKSTANYTIKSFGDEKMHEMVLERVFIPEENPDILARTPDSKPLQEPEDEIFAKEKNDAKNNFLKSIISSIQNDSNLTKNIETLRKLNYAAFLVNKWIKEPVKSKYFSLLDEQLGMISSLAVICKGKSTVMLEEGTKVPFDSPELDELASNSNAKDNLSKYDAAASKQPVKETKIDDNISFIKKKNYESFSGQYDYELISSDVPNSSHLHPGERKSIPNGGYTEMLPIVISISGTIITQTSGIYTSSQYYTGKNEIKLSGTISNGIATLNGSSSDSKITIEATINFTDPDNIITIATSYCPHCGNNQSGMTTHSKSRLFKIK